MLMLNANGELSEDLYKEKLLQLLLPFIYRSLRISSYLLSRRLNQEDSSSLMEYRLFEVSDSFRGHFYTYVEGLKKLVEGCIYLER